ncbi:hypothetical protein ABZ815_42940 [Nonomuraea sp. NPDC047529]|uniref:hypothetical protein n=1 Tax=Nonomuraea sp. NPDC047529 TaxID=3155623 RepID=UPI0033D524D0
MISSPAAPNDVEDADFSTLIAGSFIGTKVTVDSPGRLSPVDEVMFEASLVYVAAVVDVTSTVTRQNA